jgi:SAM-dependent methyltransferase
MGKQYDTIPPQLYEAMMDVVRYRELDEICETIKELNLPSNSEVIDIGAGSGRGGRYLKAQGFKNIDAIDASERYVELLEGTGAYRNRHHLYLGQGKYPFEEHKEHYDLVVSAGVWLTGHIPWKGMAEVVECMKPGATWVLAMRTKFYTVGEPEMYREGLDQLVENGKIKLV